MADFIKDWTEKEVDSLTASFKRYSLFVFILKFILPISAVVLLVMVIFFAEKDDNNTKITVENVAEKAIEKGQITSVGKMKNPRFQGLDAHNQPYSLMAAEAWQESEDEIIMQQITADITTNKQDWFSAVAAKAHYYPAKHIANLQGGVDIFLTDNQDRITQIQTESLQLLVRDGIITSDSPVNVASDLSNFSAKGFVANRNEQKIKFTGPVKLVIIP